VCVSVLENVGVVVLVGVSVYVSVSVSVYGNNLPYENKSHDIVS
jgi:hypothetical protein